MISRDSGVICAVILTFREVNVVPHINVQEILRRIR